MTWQVKVLNCDQFRLDQAFASLQQDCAARRSPAKGIGSVTLPFLFEFEAILALNLYCFICCKAIMKAIPQSWAVNSLSSPEHTIILNAAIWPQLLRKSRKLRVKGLVFFLFTGSVTHTIIFACCSLISESMCTVVYFDDCVSIRQCKLYCESMGGSKYRWFHNACCQCIGPECVDYGSKLVKCMNCLFWSAGTYWYQMLAPYCRTGDRGNYDCYVLAFLSYLVKCPLQPSSYPCKLLFCCFCFTVYF